MAIPRSLVYLALRDTPAKVLVPAEHYAAIKAYGPWWLVPGPKGAELVGTTAPDPETGEIALRHLPEFVAELEGGSPAPYHPIPENIRRRLN